MQFNENFDVRYFWISRHVNRSSALLFFDFVSLELGRCLVQQHLDIWVIYGFLRFQESSQLPDKISRAEKAISLNPYDIEAWNVLLRDSQV